MSRICVASLLVAVVTTPALGQVSETSAPSRLASRFVDPASGVTLTQAIAQAIERNPDLRAGRQDVDIARGGLTQADQRPNPAMSFDWRAEPRGTDRQLMVGIEWPLDLSRRSGRTAVADRQVTVTELAVADRERMLAGDVRKTYGDVLAAVRNLEILDQLVELGTRQLMLVRARVDEGAVPPLERDLATVELKRFEGERFLQVGKTESALARLRRLLGVEAGAPLRVAEGLEAAVARMDREQTSSVLDVSKRADVAGAAEEIRLADAKIDLAGREGRLDLSLYGTYSRMDAGFPQQGLGPSGTLERVRGQFHYVSGGVKVQLPLFDRRQGDATSARAERRKAEEAQEAIRLTAESEADAARVELQFAREALQQYAGIADALASQNVSVVMQTYELGRGSLGDVLNEQRRYLDLQRDRTEALRAAFDAHTAMRVATGEVR